MKVLISGGSGFIGTALVRDLVAAGDEVLVLSRSVRRSAQRLGVSAQVQVLGSLDQIASSDTLDAIVNLAGAPIVGRRWSDARKRLLRSSRLDTTEALLDLIRRLETRPEVLVSGSAVGYYGSHSTDMTLTEAADDYKPGFSHQLCADWEACALQAEALGVRVCLLRTGIVLGRGGALGKMLPAFRCGLGGPIGSGRQWMSWIGLEDEVAIIRFLLEQRTLRGPFNACAPEAVTNAAFATALGAALHRPARMRMPAPLLELLLGEASELLLSGQRVYPRRLLDAGYEFRCTSLAEALKKATAH
ncbi:TIGR01777 family protein [Marinobacterium aestuarii]|uniref:TIGR01777 family protein n=1 Tax=Marinobacterium aestuarii TaxID=1821621 RepID=A0A1A9EXT1_9GAMM|nr:TIGR01777 family oxidoreductase [Marinobacterium aestuarii]ANG62339.1 TIGR01777 family protein [Marinobacterium aestuarii]